MSKILLALLIILMIIPALASETSYKGGQTYILSELDTLPGDLFFGGRNLEMEGIVKGDIIVGSQNTVIKGKIGDNLYAWSEVIRIEGEVGDGVIAFAKSVIVKGKINGDLIAYGGSVDILDGSEITGDIYVGTGHLLIQNAFVHGGIQGGAGSVSLNGTIQKNIEIDAGHINFGEAFSSGGTVIITMNEMPAEALANAPKNLEIKIKPVTFFFAKFSFYWFLLSMFIIGIIIIILMRPVYDNMIIYGNRNILTDLGIGVLFLLLMPIIALISIIVLPLAFILAALYLIILYLSKIFTSYILGEFLFRKLLPNRQFNPYLTFFTGLIILTLCIKIPYVGFLITLLTMILGSGTFIYYIFKIREKNNHQKTA